MYAKEVMMVKKSVQTTFPLLTSCIQLDTFALMKTSKLDLSKLLHSEEVIVRVLNDALQSGDIAVLLRTIGYVAKARGIAKISGATGLGRESLYKA
ncbi:MAG: putative addiction module antidote protein, partial [Candidatus Saccharibacteria bacterium]|nr:putative addiction module antidote protein [Candidatus Saccharibacteria bacterium]